MQSLATNQPNNDEVANFGIPKVEIEDAENGYRFKFSNLRGATGAKGANGKDGYTPTFVMTNGKLYASNESGGFTNLGTVKGDKGDKGDQGVGVSKVELDSNGNLKFTFTDGRTQTIPFPNNSTGGGSGGSGGGESEEGGKLPELPTGVVILPYSEDGDSTNGFGYAEENDATNITEGKTSVSFSFPTNYNFSNFYIRDNGYEYQIFENGSGYFEYLLSSPNTESYLEFTVGGKQCKSVAIYDSDKGIIKFTINILNGETFHNCLFYALPN